MDRVSEHACSCFGPQFCTKCGRPQQEHYYQPAVPDLAALRATVAALWQEPELRQEPSSNELACAEARAYRRVLTLIDAEVARCQGGK